MRRLLILSVILALAAGQAGAQSSPNSVALRGSQTEDARAARAETGEAQTARAGSRRQVAVIVPAVVAPPPLMSMIPQSEAPLCRSTCARSYYFCLAAGDAAEDCSGSWAQCAARCNRPPT